MCRARCRKSREQTGRSESSQLLADPAAGAWAGAQTAESDRPAARLGSGQQPRRWPAVCVPLHKEEVVRAAWLGRGFVLVCFDLFLRLYPVYFM